MTSRAKGEHDAAEAALLAIIARFHRQDADEQTTMRAIVEYDQWWLPMLTWRLHYKQEESPEMLLVQPESFVPENATFLYTGRARAQLGDQELVEHFQRSPGIYAGGISGRDIFSRLSPEWEVVHINMGMPAEETIALPSIVFADCQKIAQEHG